MIKFEEFRKKFLTNKIPYRYTILTIHKKSKIKYKVFLSKKPFQNKNPPNKLIMKMKNSETFL